MLFFIIIPVSPKISMYLGIDVIHNMQHKLDIGYAFHLYQELKSTLNFFFCSSKVVMQTILIMLLCTL